MDVLVVSFQGFFKSPVNRLELPINPDEPVFWFSGSPFHYHVARVTSNFHVELFASVLLPLSPQRFGLVVAVHDSWSLPEFLRVGVPGRGVAVLRVLYR